MNKAVMLSIQPKWVEAIRRGYKTVELRRIRPRLSVPFKVYIYQTKNKTVTPWVQKGEAQPEYSDLGKVVGEFVCDVIGEYDVDTETFFVINVGVSDFGWKTALTKDEERGYARGKRPWGWHISNLKFYDEPKDLTDFGIDHAPQSYVYVEERK